MQVRFVMPFETSYGIFDYLQCQSRSLAMQFNILNQDNMLSRLNTLLGVCALLLVSAGCSESMTVDTQDSVGKAASTDDVIVDVRIGETVILEESGIEITFKRVVHESRCPEDVVCVTAGRAVIELDVSDPSGEFPGVELEIPGLVVTPYSDDIRNDIARLRLVELTPYPNTTLPSDAPYQASLELIRQSN
jgi:hypothetical protein